MIVIDCSMFMASLLDDESNPLAKRLSYDLAQGNQQAVVPRLFFIECSNVVVSNIRRGRITKQQAERYLTLFSHTPLIVEEQWDIKSVSALALEEGLSVYDAIYLHTALIRDIPLATLDKKLEKAARKHRVWCEEAVT